MSGKASRWWVYVLRCADGSFYTGITTDLPRRLHEHNGERPGGARYTRGRRPVVLHYEESAIDRAAAARREAALRRLARAAKQALGSARRTGHPNPKSKTYPRAGLFRVKRVA